MKGITGSEDYEEPSVFTPENLLREARRQKNIKYGKVPKVCILDPDGDLVRYLKKTRLACLDPYWACYHTHLYDVVQKGMEFGVLGCAVGASFAVLVAEQLFASGCDFLISITSAGIINKPKENTKFILIEQAIRDEGTSYRYLSPAQASRIHPVLLKGLLSYYDTTDLSLEPGLSWTTDAPYRETRTAIAKAKELNAICVEMEAAALYAFAEAKGKKVVCFARLTNMMAQTTGDFEKGEEMGSLEDLELISRTLRAIAQAEMIV